MLFLIGGEVREVRYPPVLSNEEWEKIAKYSGLREEARSQLDDCIGYYRELQGDANEKYGDVFLEALRKALEAESASINVLDALLSDSRFFDAVATGLDGQAKIFPKEVQIIRRWLRQVLKGKEELAKWYGNVRERVHYFDKPGAKTGRSSMLTLISQLNELLFRLTKQRISTGKRRKGGRDFFQYVWDVCSIANPALASKPDHGRSTVKHAIEDVLYESLRYSDVSEIGSWEHLMPNAVEAKSLSVDDPKFGIKVQFRKEGGSYRWSIDASRAQNSTFVYPLIPWEFNK